MLNARVIVQKAAPETPEEIYKNRLAKYLAETKDLSSLEKHVFYFLDVNKTFSGATVAAGLAKMHGSATTMKGALISFFNSNHAGTAKFCPAMNAITKKMDFSRTLHLGTTRVWNEDGSVNEENWNSLKKYIQANQPKDEENIVRKSTLFAYLKVCTASFKLKDKEQKVITNNRKPNGFFDGEGTQGTAADQAWNEVFRLLSAGTTSKGVSEPYMTIEDFRMFFQDSPVVYLKRECGLLPLRMPIASQVVVAKFGK